MKRIYIIALACCLGLSAKAQKLMDIEDKAFNFGAKVGFNASFPVINSLSINGQQVENIDIEYQVGYLAALFCRVNIERFFLQPSFSWHREEGYFRFSTPANLLSGTETGGNSNLLKMRTNSMDLPILVGYHLVKNGPYRLSFTVGPRFKYNYKVSYTVESTASQIEYINDNTPFGINIDAGVGVSIGRLFFDFVYEFGLNQVESDFSRVGDASTGIDYDITIDKRTNVMSISLGFLF